MGLFQSYNSLRLFLLCVHIPREASNPKHSKVNPPKAGTLGFWALYAFLTNFFLWYCCIPMEQCSWQGVDCDSHLDQQPWCNMGYLGQQTLHNS